MTQSHGILILTQSHILIWKEFSDNLFLLHGNKIYFMGVKHKIPPLSEYNNVLLTYRYMQNHRYRYSGTCLERPLLWETTCLERPVFFWQIFNTIEPVTKDHLSWKTTFSWPMRWSFKTGSTVSTLDPSLYSILPVVPTAVFLHSWS